MSGYQIIERCACREESIRHSSTFIPEDLEQLQSRMIVGLADLPILLVVDCWECKPPIVDCPFCNYNGPAFIDGGAWPSCPDCGAQ